MSVTFSANVVTVRQYPGVLFQISPKVRNISIGYGGLNTVTKNLRHYDFFCLFGPQKGQTRDDIAGVLGIRTLGGISHGYAVPFPFLLAGGASFLSHEVAKAHQRRAGGVSDANDGRHPLERSGSGMPLGAAAKQRG